MTVRTSSSLNVSIGSFGSTSAAFRDPGPSPVCPVSIFTDPSRDEEPWPMGVTAF
jgi:hypothetical protein